MLVDEGLEILTEDECRTLLAGTHLGRVGVTMGALPVILPVNFALLDGDIVFRTGEGTKLHAAVLNAVVAFEVDWADTLYHEGWSVLVVGVAREVDEPAELARVEQLPLQPWAPGERHHVVRVRPEVVSGRRIRHRSPIDL